MNRDQKIQEEVDKTMALLDDPGVMKAPKGFAAQVHAKLGEQDETRVVSISRGQWLKVAAIVAFIVANAATLINLQEDEGYSDVQTETTDHVDEFISEYQLFQTQYNW